MLAYRMVLPSVYKRNLLQTCLLNPSWIPPVALHVQERFLPRVHTLFGLILNDEPLPKKQTAHSCPNLQPKLP
jgi:hypothetical protein